MDVDIYSIFHMIYISYNVFKQLQNKLYTFFSSFGIIIFIFKLKFIFKLNGFNLMIWLIIICFIRYQIRASLVIPLQDLMVIQVYNKLESTLTESLMKTYFVVMRNLYLLEGPLIFEFSYCLHPNYSGFLLLSVKLLSQGNKI